MAAALRAGVREALKILKAGLAEIYVDRLAGAILYGSQAKGNAGEDSDVDVAVAVVLEGPVVDEEEIGRTSYWRQRISLETEVLVSCTYFPEGAIKAPPSPLRR